MTTVNEAKFTINSTPSEDPTTGDRGYTATNSETLSVTLENNPSPAASVMFAVYDSSDDESPLASKDAPLLTWVGSGAASQTLTSPNDTATIVMPGSGAHSYIIRCTVSLASGPVTFERGVSILRTDTTPDLRKTIPGESEQFFSRGYSDDLNDIVDALSGGGGGGTVDMNESYDNFGGSPALVVIDNAEGQGDLVFAPSGNISFDVDLENVSGTEDGFRVYDTSAEYWRLIRKSDAVIDLEAELRNVDYSASGTFAASAVGLTLTSTDADMTLGCAGSTGGDLILSNSTTTKDIFMAARGSGNIPFNAAAPDNALVGFTATSLIGALNELKAGFSGVTLDDAYDNDGGAAGIIVDAGDVTWALTGAYSHIVSLVDATGSVDGFCVENGADYYRLYRTGADLISLVSQLYLWDLNVALSVELDTGGYFSIDGAAASNVSVTAGNLTISTITSGVLGLDSAGYLRMTDGYKAGSTYSSDFVLSDSSAEWDSFETNFGEVSLLNATNQCYAAIVTDHGALAGLSDDDHSQYALLAGRTGGQILIGGDGTTDDLTLRATSGVGTTGSDIVFQVGNDGSTEAARFDYQGNMSLAGDLAVGGMASVGRAVTAHALVVQDNSSTGVATLGTELLTNGGFDSDLTSWTAGANWAWSAGTALHSTGSVETLTQGIATTINQHYYVEVTISDRTDGSVTMTLQNSTESFTLSANTTYKYSFKAGSTATNNLIFTPQSTFDGSIDLVTIKNIIPASTYALALYDSDGDFSGFGLRALDSTLGGIAEGTDAAAHVVSSSNFVAQGYRAGYSNTTGSAWVAQGYQAGYSNTIGAGWMAQGYQSGYSNTTGSAWVAQGYFAGRSNTTGSNWIAHGYRAGYANTTGSNWISQGAYAGYYNTTGSAWVAQGYQAGYSNTTGSNWIAQGAYAGQSNTTGSAWVAQGYQAGRYIDGGGANTTCTDFVCLGYDTRLSADGTSNEIVIGTSAIGYAANSVVLGNSSITTTILRGNTAIGTTDLDGTPATGRLTIKGTTNDGNSNIIVGRDSDEANVIWADTDGNLTLAGDLTVNGGNITSTGLIAFGAETSSHTLAAVGDVVCGAIEANNASFFDTSLTITSSDDSDAVALNVVQNDVTNDGHAMIIENNASFFNDSHSLRLEGSNRTIVSEDDGVDANTFIIMQLGNNAAPVSTREFHIASYSYTDNDCLLTIDASQQGGGSGVGEISITTDGDLTLESSGYKIEHDGTDQLNTIKAGNVSVCHDEPVELADDASVYLAPTNAYGWAHIMLGYNSEWAFIRFTNAGTVTVVDSSTNVVTSDTDANLCIITSSSRISIKNRLGSTKNLMYNVHYDTHIVDA